MAEYNFGAAVNFLYAFFMYDVCDLYIELVKPVFAGDRDWEKEKEASAAAQPAAAPHPGRSAAQATLYTTIEHFLRLLHPIMPFVTEELWQRLPSLAALQSTPSIMIAPYPRAVEGWSNPQVEADMEIVKEAIHGARSLRADYKVPNHVKAAFYFKSDSAAVTAALQAQADDFCLLAKATGLKLVSDAPDAPADQQPPAGCSVVVLSDCLTLLVNLAGIIDVDQELARLGKEVDRLLPQIDGYRRKIAAPGYDKVPDAVKATNSEKLAAGEAELAAVEAAIAALGRSK